jgi:hypothetical protein
VADRIERARLTGFGWTIGEWIRGAQARRADPPTNESSRSDQQRRPNSDTLTTDPHTYIQKINGNIKEK